MSRWFDPSRQIFWDDDQQNLTVPGTIIVQNISTYGTATFPSETNFSSINVSSVVGGNMFGNNLDIYTINADTSVRSQIMVASNSINVENLISTAAIRTGTLNCDFIDSTIKINSDSIIVNSISSFSLNVEDFTIGSTNIYTTSYANPTVIDPTSTNGSAIYLTGSGPGGHQLVVGIDGQNYLNSQYGAGIIGMINLDPIIFFTDYTERMRIASTGQVGINTSSPRFTFDVNGTGFISTISTNNLVAQSFITNSTITQTISTGYVETNTFVGRLGFISSISVNNFGFNTGSLSSFSTGSYTVGSGPNNSRGFFISGGSADRMNILSSGNVGFGMIPSTTYIVDINGIERSRGLEVVNSNTIANSMIAALDPGQSGGVRTILLGRQNTIGNAGEVGFSYVGANNVANRLNLGFVGNSTVMVMTNAGNVGIGCNAPTVRLDVAGSARFFSSSVTTPVSITAINNYIGQNLSGSDYSISQLFLGNTSFQASLQAQIPNGAFGDLVRLDFCTTSTANISTQVTRMSIMPFSGNVGIGTTTPGQRLVVNGNTQTSTLIASGVSTSVFSSLAVSVSSIFTTGNVGIGCNAPTTRLDVNGKLKVSFDGAAGITLTNTIGSGSPCELFFSNGNIGAAVGLQSTSRNFFIWQNGDKLNMDVNGNFGINCNAPSAKLDVNGTGKFNDSLLVNGNTTLPPNAGGSAYYTGGYASPNAGKLVFGDGSGWYYRFASRSGGVTTDRVSIGDNGFVGIGISVPTVPLDIAFSTTIATGSGWNWIGNGTDGPWNTSDNICLRARGTIWSERRLIIASDKRIKTNISSIDSDNSYNILQNLNPVSFDYIDKSGGPSKNIGFIAQEIEALLPNAISKQTNYIPNVYSFVSSSGTLFENSTILTFNYNLSSVFVSSPIKFYDNTNKEYLGKIVDIESSSFKIQTESIESSHIQNSYFVYGTEVNDYLTIDKDAIFTINVNATKQLIKKVHTLQEKVDTYESRISTLEGLIIKQ